MARPLRGVGTVLIAAATATCGLLMLGGVGPGAPNVETASLVPVAGVADAPTSGQSVTTDPVDQPASTDPASTDPASTTVPTTTTTGPPADSPVPLSLSSSATIVGAGGSIEFVGECPALDDAPLGPVIVWVITDETQQIDTGLTAARWTYLWTAPIDPSQFASYTFQFWCGDPSGWQGGYPSALQRTVDMVAQIAPATSTTSPLADGEAIVEAIPGTD